MHGETLKFTYFMFNKPFPKFVPLMK